MKKVSLAVLAIIILGAMVGVYYLLNQTNRPIDRESTELNNSDPGYEPADDTPSEETAPNEPDDPKPDDDSKNTLQPPVISTLDQTDSQVIVRVVLNDVKSGTCTLTMQKGSRIVTKTAPIGLVTSYYTCQGFDVNKSELGSTGIWSVKVSIRSGRGSAVSEVETINVE